MFCPECGKPLATAAAETELPAEIVKPDLASTTNAAPVADVEVQASPDPIEIAGAAVDPETREIKTITPEEPVSPHGARERTRERLHRASSVARGALEGNVKRVEKIHHVSTAMFEEATYDPSLRFVLVALGLFIVAIILLVLSKVMG
ncbi:MAG: hypothetical protein QOH41_2617 [Blastocatellia bacterium]|nr:hypothetical protein [Blastocatellia bacterium]